MARIENESIGAAESHSRKSRSGLLLVPLLVSLLGVGLWYRWGVELSLATSPPGAEVFLDGVSAGRSTGVGGTLVIPHVSRGEHTLTLAHAGFDNWVGQTSFGWFELSHSLNLALPIPTYLLRFQTVPAGVKLQLDGANVGVSDGAGNFTVAKVARGQHRITATKDGYPAWIEDIDLQGPSFLKPDLVARAGALQQEISAHLAHAQALYQERDYNAAIGECNVVLALESDNRAASSLRDQIQQTMSILQSQ
jgi:hypothetical protein